MVLAAALPARAEPGLSILPLGFEAVQFRGPSSRVASVVATSDALREDKSLAGLPLVVVWGPRGGAALALAGDSLRTVPLRAGTEDFSTIETAREAIPGSRQQAAGPLRAFLSEVSREYRHGVFGQPIEAKSLTITERRPVPPSPDPRPVPIDVTRVNAGPDAVFEDREPRFVQLGGEGPPKILVVRSTAMQGSTLAVIGRDDGPWRILAETAPTGEAQRWLNPAAVADFEGDGSVEIALVKTPHRDGVLQVWAWSPNRLVLKHEAPGYSNHAHGSAALDLAVPVSVGDGPPKLAIPTLDRRSLAILSLKGGIAEVSRIALPARASTGVAVLGSGSSTHILVGLEDGKIADVRP